MATKNSTGAPERSAITPGDVYVAAARAEHEAHCTPCRERAAASAAAIAECGESIRRRDRLTLGLRSARRAVSA